MDIFQRRHMLAHTPNESGINAIQSSRVVKLLQHVNVNCYWVLLKCAIWRMRSVPEPTTQPTNGRERMSISKKEKLSKRAWTKIESCHDIRKVFVVPKPKHAHVVMFCRSVFPQHFVCACVYFRPMLCGAVVCTHIQSVSYTMAKEHRATILRTHRRATAAKAAFGKE